MPKFGIGLGNTGDPSYCNPELPIALLVDSPAFCTSKPCAADQLQLALEEVETALAEAEHAHHQASRAPAERPRKTNRGSLPAHLERIENLVDVEDKACPCCGGALHQIGKDVSERLDIVPTTFRVLVTRRPRYGCRSCESAVVQAPTKAATTGR